MKTTSKLTIVSAIVFSTFGSVGMSGSVAYAGPNVPAGHYCLTYDTGGSDCSFTSYAQCLATVSGIDAECYGKTVRDDNNGPNEAQRSYAQARH
jgi:hypothetical protein